jgi:prophage tail gpP-like protein
MGLTDVTEPTLGGMTIRVSSASQAVEFTRFQSYEYTEDYLSPSDCWSFDIDQKELSLHDASMLIPGAAVQILVNGNVQSRGIIDAPAGAFDRDTGNVVHVEGRDWLSVAVDAQVDPQLRFVPSMTFADVVELALAPLGVQVAVTDAAANRNVITGKIYGTPTSKKGKPLKSYVLGEEKPHQNEGVFAFASRVLQRAGLWIRPAVDGKTVIIGKPDFDQEPRYGICHALDSRSGNNNALKGHFKKTRLDQPSIIFACGTGGGGNFPHSRLRAGIVNPVVNADNSAIIDAYPDVPFISVPAVTAAFVPFVETKPRAAFLYDNESHTMAQLEAFLQRELSLRMRKALEARYEIMGHELNGQPVAIDTIINVLDQQPVANWAGNLWVLGRRFHQSPNGGSRTTLDLILPGSLAF